ncbi:MAG: DNA alkylation repair protein [Planctomycetes bacterium]|nr:DNA alkylation repair protein [Planctomycetota bacterium]
MPTEPTLEALVRAAERAATTPALRSLARKTALELDHAQRAEFRRVALELVGRGARHLAYELFEARRERIQELRVRDVDALGDRLATWGDVDCFAYFVAGPAWREGVLPDAHVARWARSKDRWKRRLALVATVPLNVANRGGRGDARRTLVVCSLLAGDAEPVVVSALSWALRALVPRDRGAVERFLAVHEARLAPRVLREVRSKLRTGRKA